MTLRGLDRTNNGPQIGRKVIRHGPRIRLSSRPVHKRLSRKWLPKLERERRQGPGKLGNGPGGSTRAGVIAAAQARGGLPAWRDGRARTAWAGRDHRSTGSSPRSGTGTGRSAAARRAGGDASPGGGESICARPACSHTGYSGGCPRNSHCDGGSPRSGSTGGPGTGRQ